MSEEVSRRVRAVRVSISNFKKLRAVSIDFDGQMHVVAGKPDQGKTSVLEAVRAALSPYVPPSLVHTGADAAEIVIDLNGVGRLIRTIPADDEGQRVTGTTTITGVDGKPLSDAPKFVQSLCGFGTHFDPYKFVMLGDGEQKGRTARLREQRDMLLHSLPVGLSKKALSDRLQQEGANVAAAVKGLDLSGLDWDQHPSELLAAFEELAAGRLTETNAVLKQAEHEMKACPPPAGLVSEKNVDALVADQEAAAKAFYGAQGTQNGYEARIAERDRLREQVLKGQTLPARADVEQGLEKDCKDINDCKDRIDLLMTELERAKAALSDAEDKQRARTNLLEDIKAHEARVRDLAALEAEVSGVAPVDVSALEVAMREAVEAVAAKRQQVAHDKCVAAYTAAKERSDVLSTLVKLFRDTIPSEVIASSNLGVDGLALRDGLLHIGDVPLHQLGTAQALDIGVRMAAAMNPQCPFILIDRAESLGRSGLAALAEVMANYPGLTLLVSVVDEDAVPGPGVTVLRDGAAITN